MSADTETVPVPIIVLGIEPATAGRLIALAAVEIVIEGVVIKLHGVRIIQTRPHCLGVEPPTFRDVPQSASAV